MPITYCMAASSLTSALMMGQVELTNYSLVWKLPWILQTSIAMLPPGLYTDSSTTLDTMVTGRLWSTDNSVPVEPSCSTLVGKSGQARC